MLGKLVDFSIKWKYKYKYKYKWVGYWGTTKENDVGKTCEKWVN